MRNLRKVREKVILANHLKESVVPLLRWPQFIKAGDNLSEKMKKKFWKHKYVDFQFILYPQHQDKF